jgi:hypothetical protein
VEDMTRHACAPARHSGDDPGYADRDVAPAKG